jgi:glycine/D-amino acid oxidase-like deaminating enzyme
VNVIVIGAGIVGVSVADRLATSGASVTVLDMRAPGRGASQASAGMLAPYTEGHGHPELLALGIRSLAMFDDLIAGLQDDTGCPVEYSRTGTLELAFDAREHERLVAAKRALDAQGVPAELLDAGGVLACEPAASPAAVAGLLTRPHGFVGVESLVSALVHRARFAGARFAAPAEVATVEDRGASVEIRQRERVDIADYAVIAAGSWAGRVRVKHLPALPVRPVRGQLLHLDWTGVCPSIPDRVGARVLHRALVERRAPRGCDRRRGRLRRGTDDRGRARSHVSRHQPAARRGRGAARRRSRRSPPGAARRAPGHRPSRPRSPRRRRDRSLPQRRPPCAGDGRGRVAVHPARPEGRGGRCLQS